VYPGILSATVGVASLGKRTTGYLTVSIESSRRDKRLNREFDMLATLQRDVVRSC
jgi:hypothetical protein